MHFLIKMKFLFTNQVCISSLYIFISLLNCFILLHLSIIEYRHIYCLVIIILKQIDSSNHLHTIHPYNTRIIQFITYSTIVF